MLISEMRGVRSPGINRTIILLMVVALCVQPQFFERNFFLNEVISLIGIMTLLFKISKKDLRAPECKIIYIFIMWGIVHALTSVVRMESLYAYIRHTVMVYSCFCFFLAIWLYEDVKYWFYRSARIFKRLIIIISLIPIPGITYRLSVLYLYPLFSEGKNMPFRFLYIVVCILLLTISHGGGSGLIALFVALYFYIILKNQKIFWIVFLFILAIIFGSYLYSYDAFVESEVSGLYSLYRSLPVLAEDPNSLIRTYFWHLSINRALDSYGFGVGFGTHLFKDSQIPINFENGLVNDNLKYFLFPHNSFLGVFSRLGVLGLVLLFLVLYKLIKKYANMNKYIDMFSFSILTVFAFTLSVSFMNVVIESPITSGVFWFILGLVFSNGRELNDKTKLI